MMVECRNFEEKILVRSINDGGLLKNKESASMVSPTAATFYFYKSF